MIGPTETRIYNALRDRDGRQHLFQIGVADYPPPFSVPDDQIDLVLMGSSIGMVAAVRGQMTATRPIRLGILPGREVSFTVSADVASDTVGIARVFLVGSRLYTIASLLPSGASTSDAMAFLDSFQLVQ